MLPISEDLQKIIRIFAPTTWILIPTSRRMLPQEKCVCVARFQKDGHFLIGCADGSVKICHGSQLIRTLVGANGKPVMFLGGISSDMIVVCRSETNVEMWDVGITERFFSRSLPSKLQCLTVLSDRRVALGFMDGYVKIIHKKTNSFHFKAHIAGSIVSMIQLWNGDLVTASSDKTAKVWDVPRKRLRLKLTGHTEKLSSVDANGDTIITCSLNGEIKLWNMWSGLCVHQFRNEGSTPMKSVHILPNELVMTVSLYGRFFLWAKTKKSPLVILNKCRSWRCCITLPTGQILIVVGHRLYMMDFSV
jgi:WD40 repeat protein